MEHTIVEHTLEYPEAHKGEVVLHCMSCDDWVSTQDTEEVIAEFRNAPCPGPRQHGPEFPYEDNDEILPTTSGVPTIEDRLDAVDDAIRSVPGLENVGQVPCASGCRCDHCNGTEQHEVEDNGLREAQNYLQSEELPDHLKKHVVDDDGGPVFGSSFYSHPDFKKKEDRT